MGWRKEGLWKELDFQFVSTSFNPRRMPWQKARWEAQNTEYSVPPSYSATRPPPTESMAICRKNFPVIGAWRCSWLNSS